MGVAKKLNLREDANALLINGEHVYVSNTGSISIDPSELLKSKKVKNDFDAISDYLQHKKSGSVKVGKSGKQ